MTWFIDTGRQSIATVNAYADGRRPPNVAPIVVRTPFDDETRKKLSSAASVSPLADGFEQHIILDLTGYLVLSLAALEILKRFQSDGWEALPLKVKSATKEGAEGLVGDTYYLLNLYLHRDLVDLEKSNIEPTVLHKGRVIETTVYWLDRDHRKIAVRKDLIGDTMLWLGKGAILGNIYFVAEQLKEAWCALGVNPAVFEPCIDV